MGRPHKLRKTMKECPYCAKMISDTAIVCHYCHRSLVLPISSDIKERLIYGLIIGILIIVVLVTSLPHSKPQIHIQQELLPLKKEQSEAKQKENPKAELKRIRQEENTEAELKRMRQEDEWQLQQFHKQVREEERARNETREIDSILNKVQHQP